MLAGIVGVLRVTLTLNESPSEKEGKFLTPDAVAVALAPSMKVPPKRKGNVRRRVEP